MMASLLQMNTASTSGSGTLPGNTIANPKGELKAITTRSGLVTEGPIVPNPSKSVNPEEDECVEETYMDPDHAEYTIKVPPPPPVQKPKPPIQRNFVLHTRDSLPPHIPYPSRMLKQKQQEKDDIQIQKFWNVFKQLHLNITLIEALVLMPKYQKMLKALLSNKEKLQELANTPLNENCSAVILKKLPEKLGEPGKFLISYGFSELKCKALANLGASINLMPLSVWKKDVFVPVGKFTFLADFIVVNYESDPRVPLILGRPFLRTARALIDVHGEEMILRNEDESTTYSANSLLEEFADELALITYPPDYDDNRACDIEFDVYPDDFLEIESDATFNDDLFNSEGEKIKETKLLIDQLDLPCDIHSEYDSFNSQDFSRDDVLPSPDNEDK
nr:reverse transcriptase domain-containing protein [Tanacetum cinerariifolium]